MVLHDFHRWVMVAYLVLFAGMVASQFQALVTRLGLLLGASDWISVAAHAITYAFAALNIALVSLLFVTRRWMNPIGADMQDHESTGAHTPSASEATAGTASGCSARAD